ncbi:hypothetical protein FRC19_008317 [Serendipita sp. 401]|nr:hypothetical protein FRC19_008317 [Serendipita sp. 401]KAG8835278.1 hypothetical protein FRC18_000718 [Serendipita sp. 400]KAG9055454.1 hypothetical protein FS842_002153 [Serendipita sp. 407]
MSIVIPQYDYQVVTGWFIQDNSTQVVTLPPSFGLLDPTENGWSKIKEFLAKANGDDRVPGTIHKLLFLGRHGQGWHNVAEAKYGTAEWDRYWSKLNGDGELVWGPDPDLTPLGIEQATSINKMWRGELSQGIPLPQAMYTSPFRRAINTQTIEFAGWFYANGTEPGMAITSSIPKIVIEDLHETSGEHTCDLRNTKTIIHQNFPFLAFENGFVEEDPFWTPDHRETQAEQDVRSRRALDKIMTADGTYISVTSHSGTMASIFRTIGHIAYPVTPGGVVPVIVKATQRPRPLQAQSAS